MKKKIILLLSALLLTNTFVLAAVSNSELRLAINKYKAGNYTGCLQSMQSIVKRDPSNSVAYYYIALSYAQANKKDDAIKAYDKVLTLKPNSLLFQYASQGKACLSGGEGCSSSADSETTEIDKFLSQPFGNGLSPEIQADLRQKKLKALQDTINKDIEVSPDKEQQIIEFDKRKSINSAKPTNDEIVAAIQTLQKAGITLNTNANPYMQANMNPQMAEMSMMLGSNNNNPNNNMMNMLPFMLAQNSQTGDNKAAAYSPQLMQTMLMNSMMPDFNFNTDKDK